MLWTFLLACSGEATSSNPSKPIQVEGGRQDSTSPNLARRGQAALSLPPTNRSDAIPEVHACDETLTRIRTKGKTAEYRTTLPIRYSPTATAQLVVTAPDGSVMQRDLQDKFTTGTWRVTQRFIFLRLPDGGETIAADQCQIKATASAALEGALNFETSGKSPEDFVFRSMDQDNIVQTGLYLPPPASAAFSVTVPERGVLETTARIFEPEIPLPTGSDGAELVISVTAVDQTTEVGRHAVPPTGETKIRVDLSRWADQEITLTLATVPGDNAELDYVFLTEPTVFTPSDAPRRIVLLFIDTLRPDHLGYYGYERDTSPALDAWAEGAARFTEARGTSSWTLPSSQSVLSGLQPEEWGAQPHIAAALSDAGFYTAAFVTNVNLTPVYDMGYQWSRYAYGVDTDGAKTIDAGLALLEENSDRDVALMLHFVEPHLPYQEPDEYRSLWAGEHPEVLAEDFKRFTLLGKRLRALGGDQDAIKRYVVDRYDQNIRYLDDQLARLLPTLGDDATVVVFSDHGEEFWEHGGFEHGHTLYDEVVRVALSIRAPGITAGDVDVPVSLLDVTPTILELTGLPSGERTGTSLVAAASGDAAALSALQSRPQAFGRLLHNTDSWSVLSNNHKWITQDSTPELYDLASDSAEQQSIDADPGPYHTAMAEALGMNVAEVWRFTSVGGVLPEDTTITITHPDGFSRSWLGYDPRGRRQPVHSLTEGALKIDHHGGDLLPLSTYLLPNTATPTGLTLTVGDQSVTVTGKGGDLVLLRMKMGSVRLSISRDWVPVPNAEQTIYSTAGQEDALRALGYIE